jgi:mannose-6-phosphate isomerase
VELIDKYKGLLVGERIYKRFGNQFPLLVKFIDSRQDLSVQVHPDDKLAMERHGCAGKTEMWYVIKSDVGAKIYAGLSKNITPDEYEQLATAEPQNGRSPMQDVIATHEAHEGDLYFLPAGRLHAIINGVSIRQGETILVPASENILYIFGNATFLTATMP